MKTKVIGLFFVLGCYFNSIIAVIFISPQRIELENVLHASRASSFPYISGDSFRAAADFIIDDAQIPFETDRIQDGDVIFLKTDLLSFFFKKVHKHIKKKYILVTHNSDFPAPGEFFRYLNDDKIIAWFGQNCDNTTHNKFVQIPIGIANQYWPWGDTKIIDNVRSKINAHANRPILVYLNHDNNTHPERVQVRNIFSDKSWCIKGERKPYQEYLTDLTQARFVICPRGNGLDCHRQWEVLLMGAIPIMKHSTIDSLFDGFPVLFVNSWEEVTQEFLRNKSKKIKKENKCLDRMFVAYWLDKIRAKKQARPSIDVVIPCHPKDLRTLELVIDGIKKHGKDIARIIVVSDTVLTQNAEYFDQKKYPFSKYDIALAIFRGDKEQADAYVQQSNNKIGWVYQQLLKLYAVFVIPNISDNILMLDADTIFLRDINFIETINNQDYALYNTGIEFHKSYFEHAQRLLPGFSKVFPEYSGICHHMLMQRYILQDLFREIQNYHAQESREVWEIICSCIDINVLLTAPSCCFSEYELYFNFVFSRLYNVIVRPLKWQNFYYELKKLSRWLETNKEKQFDYISCHVYNE